MSKTKLLVATATLLLAPFLSSCDLLECGEGTSERNGVCVAADGKSPDVVPCGEGTHWDAQLVACVPDAYCPDPEAITCDSTGRCECETGGGIGVPCDRPFNEWVGSCPTPAAGRMTLCGQLVDVETNNEIEVAGGTGARCTGDETTAPCNLTIKYYDAVQFANGSTTELGGVGETYLDECGRFFAKDVPAPDLGFVGIGVTGSGYVQSGVALPHAPGKKNIRAYATRTATNDSWSTSAGLSGETFHSRGVFVGIYTHEGQRVPGVTITRAGGPQPESDYYFPADQTTVSTLDVNATVTGVNGVGLHIWPNRNLAEMSGTGGDIPQGCTWESALGGAIPSVVFITERHTVCQ